MGRKLDPTNKVKRGPGKKARKQQGAEVELAKFITDGKDLFVFCLLLVYKWFVIFYVKYQLYNPFKYMFLFIEDTGPKRLSSRARKR